MYNIYYYYLLYGTIIVQCIFGIYALKILDAVLGSIAPFSVLIYIKMHYYTFSVLEFALSVLNLDF